MIKVSHSIYDKTELIFVYGSLKRGYRNEALLYEAKSLGKVKTLKKYPLIINKNEFYPYLINEEGKGYEVIGELYRIREDELIKLDQFEGNEFKRKKVKVQKKALRKKDNNNIEIIEVNVYYYNKDINYEEYNISWAWR